MLVYLHITKNQKPDIMEPSNMTFEEFNEYLWEYVSEKIVSTKYLDDYPDFIESLTFDLYTTHLKTHTEIKVLGKVTEQFFFNLFRFNSSCEDNGYERNIDLSEY